jgi:enoyl-CoA hydratase
MGDVSYELTDTVALITVSSPEVRNGLTPPMAASLIAICDEINANQTVTAAVIRGADGTFCSGADTREWTVMLDPASEIAYEQTTTVYGAFVRFGSLLVPTIAAVRGAAVGAGLNLALAADLRVCADNARLIAGFGRAGIHPGGGFFTLFGRTGARESAAALGLFNQEMSGVQAAACGVAWESVPDGEVEERALALARGATSDPVLGRMTLKSFREELGPPAVGWPAALEMERGAQMWSQRKRAALAAQAKEMSS